MARFIVRRLLWMIPTIFVVTFLVYVVCRIGWNPVASYSRANPRAGEERDRRSSSRTTACIPGVRGYIRGYFEWLGKFLQGPDAWPKSIQGNGEVWEPLRYSFFNTLRLAGTAAVIGVGIGVGVGILASRKPGGWLDSIRQHHGILRRRHSPVRLGRHLPAGVRRAARMVARRRGLSAGPAGLRSGRDDQAHDPSDHGRGDPDDRSVLALHAGLGARRVVRPTISVRHASKGMPERHGAVQAQRPQRPDPDRDDHRASISGR